MEIKNSSGHFVRRFLFGLSNMTTYFWLTLVFVLTVQASNPELLSGYETFWTSSKKKHSAEPGFCRRVLQCRTEDLCGRNGEESGVAGSRPGSANFWKKLITEQFSEAKLFENMVAEVAKYFSRTLGWLTLDLVFYGGQSLFSRKRKKRDLSEDGFSRNCEAPGQALNFNLDDGRTFSILDRINLTPGTSQVWKKSFESQLAEQTIFNNIVNVFLNLIIRNVGWILLELIIHRGENLFGSLNHQDLNQV